jgi:hypothetical protein
MGKIILSKSIERPELISQKTKDILSIASTNSRNPTVMITSGIRSAERQAEAMYNNLKNGKRITYAAAGKEIVKIYDDNKSMDKDTVVIMMKNKIVELSKHNKLVSKHCVSEDKYNEINIVDCSTNMPNPRDFVLSLMSWDEVIKVITPYKSFNYKSYQNNRIFIDTNEPAIHIEIKQK